MYYSYHSVAKKLIREGKLIDWYYTKRHNKIAPALVLLFDDFKHPVMPIREDRWQEYEQLINLLNIKIKKEDQLFQNYRRKCTKIIIKRMKLYSFI